MVLDQANPLRDKSKHFAVRIINLYRYLKKARSEYVLSNQLLKSGTSIGANITEGLYGCSKKDFLAKLHIALKECAESQYWIELLYETGDLTANEYESIMNDCIELGKLLTSIIKSTRKNLEG